jgi:lipoprotein-anchoring transpeptidase ErfK/SrfK
MPASVADRHAGTPEIWSGAAESCSVAAMGRPRGAFVSALVLAAAACAAGCKKDATDPAAAMLASATPPESEAAPKAEISKTAKLASIALQTNVYAKPSDTSRKLGYLRLGAIVPRSDSAFGTEGCPGGWYAIAPRGFVCVGKTATLDLDDPLVKAANVRPDTSRPLPYAYGFVRAVAPLYLRPPSKEEALAAEFKLEQHLSYWERKGHAINDKAVPGANDAAREIFPDATQLPRADTVGDGVLLGGRTENDPPPFWLEGGQRKIPNVSGFEVPSASYFANRVRRHTGIAFVGAFQAGPEFMSRRFAVTVDMRLLPIDKVKPETASAFHGVELNEKVTLPVAFAKPCDRNAKGEPKPCVHTYEDDDGTLKRSDDVLPTRAFLELTGVQKKNAKNTRFLQTKAGAWVRAQDVGVAVIPSEWPQAALKGERWVDVSIEEQTLVLWEGKRPVYVTLVSTGQDGMEDPKTSKATPRGTFRIKSKHVTTTMDSNERSTQSGGAAPDRHAGESPTADDKHAGQFELRDVPYVQYFQDGYALHSAYWHDHFGLARSHGCINLAPIDALRVFRFTEPQVPDGWHATTVEPLKGSAVVIHR